MNSLEFIKKMKAYFGITHDVMGYVDMLCTPSADEIKIDVIKFDDWLHKKHGKYERKYLSMGEAITKYYSKEASDFIQSML